MTDSEKVKALSPYLNAVLRKHFQFEHQQIENASMNDEDLKTVYQRAIELYNSDQAQDASLAFGILIRERPFSKSFWMGLAASRQKLKEFEKALEAYAMTSLIDDQDPLPHYHASQCYVAINNKEEAIKAINLAEALAFNNQKFSGSMDRIQKFKNDLRSI